MTSLSKYIQSPNNLEKAWARIRIGSAKSTSPYIQDDLARFSENTKTQIRSIAGKLQHGSYTFSPARGVVISKAGKPGSQRPIVMPKIEDRIVQRCLLDAMMLNPDIRQQAFQPNSFGGVPKTALEGVGGVAAAIKRLLEAIEDGATHVMVADISKFFTRINKIHAIDLIKSKIDDEKFINVFSDAITVDLDNSSQLSDMKYLFPYGDIGVGQGVCLSPFIGNMVLSDFDAKMNAGDCVCIRYIDDFIIIAPNGQAASSRLRLAVRLLGELGMEVSQEKTSRVPIQVHQPFEYLGIEFANGLIRPSKKSRLSIQARCKDVAAASLAAMNSSGHVDKFDIKLSIPRTLEKISGMSRGWAHHYKFCNDKETIFNVDRNISKIFLSYIEKAQKISSAALTRNKPDLGAKFLGYQGAKAVKFDPLIK